MNNIIIRKETKEDYYNTEHMILRSFWNLHGPGCNEHYLVHALREAREYLPELSRVAEMNGKIVGAIFYSISKVIDGDMKHDVLTFGPLAVEPTCFSMGIGKRLLEETIIIAKEAGYKGIVICGEPNYYPKYGFKTCDNFGIIHPVLGNFDAFMAYPLNESFGEIHGSFFEAPVFEECEDETKVKEYTKKFPYYKPLRLSCQWLHEERLGRISAVMKNGYQIRFWENDLKAKLKGDFYEQDSEKLPVVGDYVTFRHNPNGDSVILSVCERSSFLQRPDQAKTGVMQYMVANVDFTFIVTSLNEDYSYNRIARYVSLVIQGGSVPVVILTKADLCSNCSHYVREVEAISHNVKVHAISALYNIGLEELSEYFFPGTTICLIGSSGVGKSTLINAIVGKNILKTAEVREYDSTGRHTTTQRQLVQIDNGVCIIDTPGMREVGMANMEEGIDSTFSDIIELESRCKFRDCRHETEPGCAIKAAIDSGELSIERYELYRNLGEENKLNYAKKKEISKWRKAHKRFDKRE
ncbi:ribosome small subunit-dependent GTPase A [Butyrivibrio sp. AE3004]|uniref:ribosome small subunit-dependent GTPase A n=1 Tax=Butyrivibrio sp. AE3004 TaxID=1506994 RepID=UPI000B264FA0|nr:ribosome small subunit-dependent GTPase A [Butyrivibrio sp. AE3004]